MKIFNLAIFISILATSCTPYTKRPGEITRSVDSSGVIENIEGDETDIKQLRKEYIASYNKTEKLDTIFTNPLGKEIRVQTSYYCLFDNAVLVPKQYVWEDTNKIFVTHNYAHDILIVIDKDTIFNKTITKTEFADKLYAELKSYAVLSAPNFHYDKDNYVFSLSIPITDIGEGWEILIDEKGSITKMDR